MGYVVCEGCGLVVPGAPGGCASCAAAAAGPGFGRAVLLLGLTLSAGCPPNVSAKYGAEVVDTEEPAETDETDE
jgi:hypothetical protein